NTSDSRAVGVIDLDADPPALLPPIPVPEVPWKLAVDEAAHRVVVEHRLVGSVSVIDASGPAARLVTTLEVTPGSGGVAADPVSHRTLAASDRGLVVITPPP